MSVSSGPGLFKLFSLEIAHGSIGLNFLVEIYNLFKFLNLSFILFQLAGKFVDDGQEDNEHSWHLDRCCLMSIVNNANEDCQYFSGCYHEWHNVLLELFDHSIYEELASAAHQRHAEQVQGENGMVEKILECGDHCHWANHRNQWYDCHPFVDVLHHLGGLRFVLCLNFSLEIWQKSISQQRDK